MMKHPMIQNMEIARHIHPNLYDLCCIMINFGEVVEMFGVGVGDVMGMFAYLFVLLSVV